MLPPAHRMRRGSDFSTTTRQGAKVTRGHVIAYVHRSGTEPALVGFVVGRKVGGSVVRHRVARRLRAALAGAVGELPPDAWVVIRALPGSDGDGDLGRDTVSAVALAIQRSTRGRE